MEKGGGGAAPTGCYKCGRPGHWSRDCPSNPTNNNPNNATSTTPPNTSQTRKSTPGGGGGASSSKAKAAPRTRPKLTPDSLLSDDGLGYILRHFPRAFKYHGRGHEVSDLGRLLGLYAKWHSRLLPYYSFDQFVHKVERVGASKRVKLCLRDLRERVANGVDPTKLHEPEVQEHVLNGEQENRSVEEPSSLQKDAAVNLGTDDFQQEMVHEIWESATKEPTHEPQGKMDEGGSKEPTRDNASSDANKLIEISEEQRARMQANKFKALQRAAAAAAARSAPPPAL